MRPSPMFYVRKTCFKYRFSCLALLICHVHAEPAGWVKQKEILKIETGSPPGVEETTQNDNSYRASEKKHEKEEEKLTQKL